MTFAEVLLSLAGPAVKRAAVALGLGVVTSVGLVAGANALLTQASASLSGLPADAVQLLAMGGFFEGLGLLAGAMLAKLGMEPIKRLGFVS